MHMEKDKGASGHLFMSMTGSWRAEMAHIYIYLLRKEFDQQSALKLLRPYSNCVEVLPRNNLK